MTLYFQHCRAWRAAFLDLVELEQPEELRSRGVETQHGPYHSYEEETKAEAGVGVERRTRLSQNRR